MSEWLPAEVKAQLRADLAQSYGLFALCTAYIPTFTECEECGGVDDDGEPFDITCEYCDRGYVVAWSVYELQGRISDIAHVTQIFVSITPGIEVGDKLLTVMESDAPTLALVQDVNEAYLEVDGLYWRPKAVQPSQFGKQWEYMAHLVKCTPEVLYA